MGIEYKIRILHSPAEGVDQILRDAPHFSRFVPEYGLYEYCSDSRSDVEQMPAASLAIKEYGFYFCDHCGDTNTVSDVLSYLRQHFTHLGEGFWIEDLE